MKEILIKQGTPEWHAWRTSHCGGSEAAIPLGLNPWQKPIDLCMSKWYPEMERRETPAMRLGKRLEPVIREMFTEETGLKVELAPNCYEHDTEPWMGGSFDGFVVEADGSKAILEIKTSGNDIGWGDAGTAEIPDYYRTQVAWYLAISQLPRAYVAALLKGKTFRVYVIERDLALEEAIVASVKEFWTTYVVARVTPPVDSSPSWKDYFDRQFPRPTDTLLVATDQAQAIMDRIYAAKCKKAEAEAEEATAANEMRAIIGPSAGIAHPMGDWKVTYRSRKAREKQDWKGICEWLKLEGKVPFETIAEGIRKFTSVEPGTRVFLPTWKKEED